VSTQATRLPSPERAIPRSWIAALLLATGGVFAGWFGPIQILLPAQAAGFAGDGTGKEALLALVTGIGAVASLVANPLWGLISDRMSLTRPRRRPIVVAGTLVGIVGLVVLSLATDAAGMIAGWVLVQVGLNGPFAALIAMIADRVPSERRGMVGSLFGVAQIAGVVLGTAVAMALGEGALGYVALAVAVPALCIAVLVLPEERLVAADPDAGAAGAHRGIREVLTALRPSGAFAWAWTLRLLLNLVNALVLVYLYYYLSDGVGVDDPGTWVLVLTLVNVVITAIGAGVGGAWSDRIARRKVFVVAGALVLAAGAGVFAALPVLPAVIAATVLIGVGWGLYVSVDVAIITQVLPSDRSVGSMLGVANIASALPQALAPLIAAPIVTGLGGYPVLYVVTGAIALLALACLPRLRAVA